ncbi:MAG TPA: PAS domain-containing protein [Steroidobacteraceae bacterium]|jgi:signal transduction histidine kinase
MTNESDSEKLPRRSVLAAFPLPLVALILALSVAGWIVAGNVHDASLSVARAAALSDDPELDRVVEHLGSLQAVSWYLLVGQLLIAGIVAWTIRQSTRRTQVLIAKEAEQSQERSERETERSQALLDRLSIATQAAGIYCWEFDWVAGTITWDASRLPASDVAAASRRHFGAELGSDLFKWVHPDDQHCGAKAMLDSLARGEDHVSFRYRLVLPNGAIRHVQAYARTYSDAAGKPLRSLGVSWDVTAEVEAAAEAARNAANERAMLDRLSVATQAAGLKCWEFDYRQDKVVWLDQGFAQQETTPEAIAAAGKAMLDQILPQDGNTTRIKTEEALTQRRPILSSRARSRDADGSLHHILMYQRLFYDEQGQPARSLGAMLDVTESYQRQAELEALSIRFGIATRAANAGVWEFNCRTDEVWWNDTMYLIYRLSPETFRPTLHNVIEMIHRDDLPLAQSAWAQAMEQSGQLRVQFRVVRADGTVVHLEQVAAVVNDTESGNRRLVGITLNITERVEAEQRERMLQKQLREASHQSGMAEVATGVLHNVGNVLNSLGIAHSTAQTRLKNYQIERVSDVAGMLEEKLGDLPTFLTQDDRGKRLPKYLSALGAKLKGESAAVQREFDAISGHIQYLRQIVQAQQSFARIGGAQDEVDVRELLETALTLKSSELKGIEVVRDFGDLPTIHTDRYKLLQVIVNFVANACDAITANKNGPARLFIRVHTADGQLEIAVEDSGIGIQPELLSRVWEFGFTTKAHGHGFGLHSAALAAQQLGGSVDVQSQGAGTGARFSVTIPISARAEAEREAAA